MFIAHYRDWDDFNEWEFICIIACILSHDDVVRDRIGILCIHSSPHGRYLVGPLLARPLSTSDLPFVRIVFLDEIADEELPIHTHHMSHTRVHLDVETLARETFSVYTRISWSIPSR